MIYLFNKKYWKKNHSGHTTFLLSNVGQIVREQFALLVNFNFTSNANSQIRFIDNYTIELVNGTEWNTLGASVGDVVQLTGTINNAGSPIVFSSLSLTVESITGPEIRFTTVINSSIELVGQLMPLTTGSSSTTNTALAIINTTATAPEKIEFLHNIINNDSAQSNSSLFDGEVNRFTVSGVKSMSVSDQLIFTQVGNKSGGSYIEVKLTRNADAGTNKSYLIDLEYSFPYKNESEFFDLTNSLKSSYEVKCLPQANNPNSGVFIKDALTLGNVGYLNQNYSQNVSTFTVDSVVITDEDDVVISKLDYSCENKITATILGTGAFLDKAEVEFWLTNSIKNQPERYADIISLSNGFIDDTTATYELFGKNNQQFTMSDLTIDVTTTNEVTFTFKLTPTTEFTAYIESLTPDLRGLKLTANVEISGGTTNNNNAVTVTLIDDFLEKTPRVGGEWEGFTPSWVSHNLPPNKNLDTDTINLCTEDDFGIGWIIELPENTEFNSIKFAIEVVSGGESFALQEETINLSNLPMVGGVIQVDYTKNYAQFLESPERNKLQVFNYSPVSSGIYELAVGWILMANWRTWITQSNAFTEFFDFSLPLNGQNAEWMRYLRDTVGVNIQFKFQLTDSEDVTYTNTFDIPIQDYDDSEDITSEIKIYDENDNVVTSLISGQIMRIEAIHTKDSGTYNVDSWGWISVHPKEAEENKRIGTVWDWTSISEPLRPLIGETKAKGTIVGGVATIECLIDCTTLPFGSYTLITRIENTIELGERNVHKEDFKLVGIPREATTNDCGLSYCLQPQLVLSSTTETINWKNDKTSFAFKFDSIDVKLVKNGIETDAVGYAFTFPNQTDAVGFVIDWRQNPHGCHRVKIYWEKSGLSGWFWYGDYRHLPYTCKNAEGTTRLFIHLDDFVRKQAINYKGSGFYGTVRFQGMFGFMQPNYETENIIYSDRKRHKVRIEAVRSYELYTDQIQRSMSRLLDEDTLLCANNILISDHNNNNHDEYKDFPVILSEDESPQFEYSDGITASLKAVFLEKVAISESRYSSDINAQLPVVTTVLLPSSTSIDIDLNGAAFLENISTDQNITVVDENDNVITPIVTGNQIKVIYPPCPVTPVGGSAMPLATGQTISYEDDDDGDTQRGRPFFTLPIIGGVQQLNHFGTKWRFTGHDGSYYDYDTLQYKLVDGTVSTLVLTFPDKIVCDWSTRDWNDNILMYRYDFAVTANWATSLNRTGEVYGGFGNWKMGNPKELLDIMYYGGGGISYPPYNAGYVTVWTSNSLPTSPAGFAICISYGDNTSRYYSKTNSYASILTRITNISEL